MELATAQPIAESPAHPSVLLRHSAGSDGRPAPDDCAAYDAYDAADETDAPAAQPAVSYPPYAAAALREYLRRTMLAIASQADFSLTAASEPGLYTLAAAVFSAFRNGELPDGELTYAQLIGEVRRELIWRDCRAMGHDPTGAIRRGRLLQLIGSFTTLSRPGASPLQRRRVSGDCPFCAGVATLSVFLESVRWRCFGCGRQGGLPEFAAAMLDSIMPPE